MSSALVEVWVEDQGPGIPNVELAMKEGYSTAPDHVRALGFGAGMGLPNIRRLRLPAVWIAGSVFGLALIGLNLS